MEKGNRKRLGKNNPKWTGCGEISGAIWADIKAGARVREIPFSIEVEEAWNLFLKQNRKCALSGEELFIEDNRTASLDRIDSKEGYVLHNIQWIHKTLNIMKQSFSQQVFVEFCQKVANHCGEINE